jgi:hypothetical protein
VLNETQLKNKELVKARKSAGLEPVQEPREDIDLKFAKGMLKANKVFYTKQQTIKVLPPQPEKPDYQSKIEKEAMNIVYQIGDLLSFNIPISIVDARQKTNDKAIDFVSDQLLSLLQEVRSEERNRIKEKRKTPYEHFLDAMKET